MRRADDPRGAARGWAAIGALVTAGLAVWAVGSCTQTPRQQYERRTLETSQPALHAVQSDRLRQIMDDLDRMAPGRWPQEMDPGPQREARIREFAEVAEDMAEAARHIPDVLEGVRLAEEDRRYFVRLAARMRQEAMAIEGLAHQGNVAEMETALERVAATCNACHSAFRVMPKASSRPR